MADDWRPAIRALTYCILFDNDPTQAVDYVIRTVVDKGALGRDRDSYREAVASALSSNEPLASLLPHSHSEETIRRFLELVLARL